MYMANEHWDDVKVIYENQELPARITGGRQGTVLINLNMWGRDGFPMVGQRLELLHEGRAIELEIIEEDGLRRAKIGYGLHHFYLTCKPV